jgi:hypothetical protein
LSNSTPQPSHTTFTIFINLLPPWKEYRRISEADRIYGGDAGELNPGSARV